MKLPCEIAVWYLLPVLKSELAKELVSSGLSQREVAEKLGVTQAAVSQYISGKRGNGIASTKYMGQDIKKLAKRMVSSDVSEDDIVEAFCFMCMKSKSSGMLCDMHRGKEKVPDDCDICIKIGKSYCHTRV